jgi:hypothetical protein
VIGVEVSDGNDADGVAVDAAALQLDQRGGTAINQKLRRLRGDVKTGV